MKLIISFSGRKNGNCDQIAEYIAGESDKIIHLREMGIHPCMNCKYECFEKWFACTGASGRVLGIERHPYNQKMRESILDVEEVWEKIRAFLEC